MSTEFRFPSTYKAGYHDESAVRKMVYRPLGKTGMDVSILSFGASALGSVFRATDDSESIKVVEHAVKSGINYIDTAPWYGHGKSETVLGKALKNIPRECYYLSTKVCRYLPEMDKMFDFSAERTLGSIDESLQRLGLEYVDVIQIHDMEFAPNLDIVINETLPALKKIKDAGKAKFIGITGYPLENFKTVLERSPVKIDTILTYCHGSMNDNSLADYLPYFKSKKEAKGNPYKSAPAIVDTQIMNKLTTDVPCPALPAPINIARAANRARRKHRPNEPTDLDFELADDYLPEDFLIGDIRIGRYRHLVFASSRQLDLLASAKTWYLDATFKIVKALFKQLFSVHAFVRSGDDVKQVPLAFALMSKKRSKDYEKEKGVGVVNASAISMGLLSNRGPPSWHPAKADIKDACKKAAEYCESHNVDISKLGMKFTLDQKDIPTTLVSTASFVNLEKNLASVYTPLSETENLTLEEVMERFMKPLKNKTWEGVEVKQYRENLSKTGQ